MAKWDNIKKVMKEKFSFAAEKTEEYTKIGKVRVEIMAVKKNLDKAYKKLGEETFILLGKDKKNTLLQNEEVKAVISEIKTLQISIKEKEKEIGFIKEEAEKNQAEAAPEEAEDK